MPILDRVFGHTGAVLAVPEGWHLVYPPAQTPELRPAEHLWPLLNEAVVDRPFTNVAALDDRLEGRCRRVVAQPERIQAATAFQWWPAAQSGGP